MEKRVLESIAFDEEWGRQMRFIAGPRQCGKTTLARNFLSKKGCDDFYFNWDNKQTRISFNQNPEALYQEILSSKLKLPWICFDEIHKIHKWKNILKSHFDQYEQNMRTIVTGSARLDLFRRSGDSLAGRYFLFQMHPLILSELDSKFSAKEIELASAEEFIEARLSRKLDSKNRANALNQLLEFSGFPEPFSRASKKFHRTWQDTYTERLIFEDLQELSGIENLDAVSNLVGILPSTISNPLSINQLRLELELNHQTVKNHLKYLELTYLTFELKPYAKNLRHMIRKEKKLYFYDWTRVTDEAARFENYLACELKALCSLWTNSGLAKVELFYLRANNKKESDFLIVKDSKPWLILEAKLSSINIEAHHYSFAKRLGDIPIAQILQEPDIVIKKNINAFIISANRFL